MERRRLDLKQTEKFEKKQFLESKTFDYPKDLVQAILKDGIYYSRDDAKKAIEAYLTKEIHRKEN